QNYSTTATAIFDGNLNQLTLNPAPTNASNDPVDGTFTVATLQVTSFTPNPSGFAARFNLPINTNVLHLYTSALNGNTAGPPDVTLVGNSTGPVTGSVVLDPDG